MLDKTDSPVKPKEDLSGDQLDYKKEYSLSGSAILNKPDCHHTAAIAHRLTYEAYASYNKVNNEMSNVSSDISGSVWISDCNRSISLALDTYDDKTGVNGLFKLDTLIKELKICKKNFKKMLKEKISHDTEFQKIYKKVKMNEITTSLEEFKEIVNK